MFIIKTRLVVMITLKKTGPCFGYQAFLKCVFILVVLYKKPSMQPFSLK